MLKQISLFLEQNTLLAKIISYAFSIILILIIAAIIKRITTKIVLNYLDKKGTKQSITLKGVAESTIKYLISFFVVTAILDQFGVSFTSIMAVAGIGSVAIGFGAQSLVKDVITGAFILFEDQFGVGDYVELKGKSGQVEKIGLRTTLVRNVLNNEMYIIPNSEISVVTNQTRDFQRALVHFELPYDVALEPTLKIVEDALEKIEDKNRLLGKPIVYGAVAFNESGINVRVTCDTISGEVWSVERDIRKIVKSCLEAENIEIPYPTQTVHIIEEDK